MPTYQYACTECGHQLEAVQSFSDPALTECPVCHGKLRKVFSPVGVVFKGSGFYRTDSRGGSKTPTTEKPAAKTDTASSTSPSSDSSSSSTASSTSSGGNSSTSSGGSSSTASVSSAAT